MTIALLMAAFAFNNATYDFNDTTLNKISNTEIKTALADLNGRSFDGQAALFEEVETKLNSDQFLEFKRNEITNTIKINATLVLITLKLAYVEILFYICSEQKQTS